ncbi:hypothetical protein DEI92_13635 [Curtobacterium sp. MCBD17_034]|nr:hypothetical protein DEI92_13635 [Curtobacterium sp. MCBD17_034]PZM33568.1 hypothetical protein DEI90_12165 [Curtobacterium sp. MCBD17_031]
MTFDHAITGYGTYQDSTVDAGAKQATVTRNLAPRSPSGKAGTLQPRSSTGQRQTVPNVTGKASPGATGGAGATATSPQTRSRAAAPPVEGADGAYVSFDTSSKATVQTNVGISYVSTANAKKNRTTENGTFAFDHVESAATASWNAIFSKIQVGGGDTAAQKTFYTAMYHALLHPNVFSDVNGQYAGFDGQVHTAAKGHTEYANYSGWDIYRSQVQLAATVAPQQTSDSVRSMLNQYDQTGQLPKWALNNGESYAVVLGMGVVVVADALGRPVWPTVVAGSAAVEVLQPARVTTRAVAAIRTIADRGVVDIEAFRSGRRRCPVTSAPRPPTLILVVPSSVRRGLSITVPSRRSRFRHGVREAPPGRPGCRSSAASRDRRRCRSGGAQSGNNCDLDGRVGRASGAAGRGRASRPGGSLDSHAPVATVRWSSQEGCPSGRWSLS